MAHLINETKRNLTDFVADSLHEFCQKASVTSDNITLVIKERNHYRGKCWAKKGNRNIPSGCYNHSTKTVTIRISRKTSRDDFRFVLAHEIGHYKQYSEAPRLDTTGDFREYIPKPETYANKFALLTCNCYPKSNYKIKRI